MDNHRSSLKFKNSLLLQCRVTLSLLLLALSAKAHPTDTISDPAQKRNVVKHNIRSLTVWEHRDKAYFHEYKEFDKAGNTIVQRPCPGSYQCYMVYDEKAKVTSKQFYEMIRDSLILSFTENYTYDEFGNLMDNIKTYPDGGIRNQSGKTNTKQIGDTSYTYFYDKTTDTVPDHAYRLYTFSDSLFLTDYLKFDDRGKIREISYSYTLTDAQGRVVERGEREYDESELEDYLRANPKLLKRYLYGINDISLLDIPELKRNFYTEEKWMYDDKGRLVEFHNFHEHHPFSVEKYIYNTNGLLVKKQYFTLYSHKEGSFSIHTYDSNGLIKKSEYFDTMEEGKEPDYYVTYEYEFYN